MDENLFETYYDEHIKMWTVKNRRTNIMYPCTSEINANEFTDMLNGLNNEKEYYKKVLTKCAVKYNFKFMEW